MSSPRKNCRIGGKQAVEASRGTEQAEEMQAEMAELAAELAEALTAKRELLEALKGIAWKLTAYGSKWEPSQAERSQLSELIARNDTEIY